MVNFAYLIGDTETREAVIVDPAYGVAELVDAAEQDGMKVVGALATHYHPDHVGGSMMGHRIEGVHELLGQNAIPIHVQRHEASGVQKVTGCAETDLMIHDGGDTVMVGEIPITLLHTPGHTPGSQCFLVDGRLVSGDTLFLEGCGRVDLPGASPEAMYESLNNVLGKLPDSTIVFPGHLYSEDPSASLADIKAHNYVYRFQTLPQFMTMFGG